MAVPVPHNGMSQSCVPAKPAFGHVTTQLAPAGHTVWQGPLAQWKLQLLPAAHVQVPSAHVPSQWGLLPSQVTWQGGALQAKEHVAPVWHVQSPLAHAPVHFESAPHATWQGGLAQEKLQSAPLGHAHVPSEQSALPPPWLHARAHTNKEGTRNPAALRSVIDGKPTSS